MPPRPSGSRRRSPGWGDPLPLTLATIRPGEPEIFAALQGEGVSAGTPCTFVRLSRCNLACVWCDTAYTWHFTGDARPHRGGTHDRAANQVTLAEADVAARIAALAPRRLVVTGGEPLLQAPALGRLLALLPEHTIEVETNGTIPPPPALDRHVAQYNLSPKLAHSGNPRDLALTAALARFARDPRAWFKFVVAAPGDIAEVRAIAAAHGLRPDRIVLMPEGTDGAALSARLAWLAEISLAEGWRLSDRLHIHLHGDTRGT